MYDPYAPPKSAEAPRFDPAPLAGGAAQPWRIGEVVGLAFDRVRDQAVGVFLTYVVYLLLSTGVGFVSGVGLGLLHLPYEVHLLVNQLFSFTVTAFLQVGLCRIAVAVARGERFEIGALFTGGGQVLSMLVAMFLYVVLVAIGMLALFVPGIVVAIGLSLYPYYVAVHRLGPVAALDASWQATRGMRGRIFGLQLVLLGVVLASVLVLCIGVVFGVAIAACAHALVFLRVTGAEPSVRPPASTARAW